MKKTFCVTAYEAYDYTEDWRLGDLFETLFEAQEKIRFDDMERHEHWRQSQWYNHGCVNPFAHHEYAVLMWYGLPEIEVEDDYYEPSFHELCEAVEEWEAGEFPIIYKF